MAQGGECVGVDVQQVAYLFAVLTGLVSSGMIGSLWAALTNEAPHFGMLNEGDHWTPVKIPVLIFSGPTTTIVSSFEWFFEQPLAGIVLLLLGLTWSFFQGVFILTQFFGVS